MSNRRGMRSASSMGRTHPMKNLPSATIPNRPSAFTSSSIAAKTAINHRDAAAFQKNHTASVRSVSTQTSRIIDAGISRIKTKSSSLASSTKRTAITADNNVIRHINGASHVSSRGHAAFAAQPKSLSASVGNVMGTRQPQLSLANHTAFQRPFSTQASNTVNTDAKPNEITWKSDIYRTKCGLHVDRGLPPTFDKILIANRGEIACRVIRTCRELGIKTVAVYSDADANSMFVKMADEAYRIGPAASAESYLRGDYIIGLAKKVGAQAIHPGYGFLSENAGFAESCFKAGIEFMGPPVGAITAMGSKSASKNIMEAAGVRCVPGYHGEDQSTDRLKEEALKVGYPIMLKAVLGGGGKGMRIVWNPDEFEEALDSCKRESLASFKDDRVLLERYIQNPRHIEFQVFADKQGNAVHLYERDCSVQRRHQKVFEEAPAPGMSVELRNKMGKSATDAAKAVGYVGAGTVEFIVDADTNEYFFMEMNTRLQVEHCVSEMIVHRDLVQWQLHVAAGYRLPADQEGIDAKGHALELRVYAENPRNNFFPATGRLAHMKAPEIDEDIRVETGVRSGDSVSIHYDPMISKLVVWGKDRNAALNRMIDAIDNYQIAGLPTNLEFAKTVLKHQAFRQGEVTTKFIPTYHDELLPPLKQPDNETVSLIALDLLLKEQQAATKGQKSSLTPWVTNSHFRVNDNHPTRRIEFECEVEGEKKHTIAVDVTIPKFSKGNTHTQVYDMKVVGSDETIRVEGVLDAQTGEIRALIGDKHKQATVFVDGPTNEVHAFGSDGSRAVVKLPVRTFGASLAAGGGAVAPMASKVVKVNVKAGDHVVQGQPLVVMEAMKMEHVLRAGKAGVIKSVLFSSGDFVEGGKAVVVFEEADE